MYIVRKETENQARKYLLKLNRGAGKLEIYRKADNSILNEHYSIRPDFDSSDYMMYEKMKSLLANPELAKKISHEALKVRDTFPLSKIAKRWIDIL